ncbi:MAG: hypothetical protein ACXWTN_12370 [Methylosarcina sp.]
MRYRFLALALFSVSAIAADGLCRDPEQTIFSCTTHKSAKLLSVCASSTLNKADSYIQYRFGTLKKIELKFPAEQKNSIPQFKFAHYFRYRVDRTELSFSTGPYRYAVFHFYEGDIEPPETREGITVSKSGEPEKETEILCVKPAISHLHLLENIIPCDRESALASCE